MNTAVLVSTFLAASIEVIEIVAIVVAVGATRQWRGALAGTLAGLVVLAVLIAALGTALQRVPLSPIRVVVGALLLTFGLQWVRKGVRSVSRDGWTTGIGEQQVEEDVGDGFDWTGFLLAFRGVSLEGLEVAVIVVAFGAAEHAITSSAPSGPRATGSWRGFRGERCSCSSARCSPRSERSGRTKACARVGPGRTSHFCGWALCTSRPRSCWCAWCRTGVATRLGASAL